MYNRLYFYAVGQDYLDLVEKINEIGLNPLPPYDGARSDLLSAYGSSKIQALADNSCARFLSFKPMSDVTQDIGGGFSIATYDVISWARGYIHNQQLVGHMILQTLPRFDKPNPTPQDLVEFEDAKALRSAISKLRRWMKKNWIDHYKDGDFFGPEALRLKLEENYSDASYELDNEPPTTYIYT